MQSIPAVKCTISDRFKHAWQAFCVDYKPDPAVMKQLQDQAMKMLQEEQSAEEKREEILDKLTPFTKSLAISVMGDSGAAEQQLQQIIDDMDGLRVETQREVLSKIVDANPRALGFPAMKNWTAKNASYLRTWADV